MAVPRLTEAGHDAGKWFMVESGTGRTDGRRAGYCARRCAGHATRAAALAHQLEFQFDHELELGLERRATPLSCEICGDVTTLRAQLGIGTPLLTLCWEHQSTHSVREAVRGRDQKDALELPLVRVG